MSYGGGYGGETASQRRYMGEEDLEESLKYKTTRLKEITISLGEEIRQSNKFLDGLDKDFEKSRGFMESTMLRVTRLIKTGGNCKIYFTLMLFALFVFFVLYLVIIWF